MKKMLLCVALAIVALCPTLSIAAEPSLVTQRQIDDTIAKYFPRFKPCPTWDQEHLGLRCMYINRPGFSRFNDMLYISVTVQNDGLIIIQNGGHVHAIDPDNS